VAHGWPWVGHRKVPLCGAAANPHGRYARAWEQTCGTPAGRTPVDISYNPPYCKGGWIV
jgi:hypothetical protein